MLGGGYVNTELRAARATPRVFDAVDFITLDDGERPLLALIEHLRDPARPLFRTYVREAGAVVLKSTPTLARPAPPRHRHADLRRAAARSLRVAVRDAEPDAPAVGGRALEQADRRARLLLEEVHVLRRLAGLHRALRAGVGGRHSSIASRRWCARPGETGFHFVDEAAPPGGAARAGRAADRAQASRSPGGATSASRRASRPSWPSCWRAPAASR